MRTFDWGVAVALLAVVLFLMFAACGLVVAIGVAANRRRADLTWTAVPGPATSWDEHTATALAVLSPDALDVHLDQGVATGAEEYLRRLANPRRREW